MTRLRADLIILFVAAVWGTAFVAQKSGMEGLGPLTFIASRFFLSLLVVLPFLLRDLKRAPVTRSMLVKFIPVCIAFLCGVYLQQVGVGHTSVTNAGFITGLYVIFTPFISWMLFRHAPSKMVWPACALMIAGMYFLNGGSFTALGKGDLMILACSVSFGFHVALTGWFLASEPRPIFLVSLQYFICTLIFGIGAFAFESVSWDAIQNNWMPITYAGIISGGVAYTLQAVAQQYTPPSDAAIIMAGEALFAALAGMILLGETFTGQKILGCTLIMLAVLSVEALAFFKKGPSSPAD
ncbi:MAG: EamA family transporter [Micavibrio aeruginosavorus]|uniref:EamA family transporter n=1 Tax=Micavibrio aeruginosavorus TaxID=349221 RepID=A0A2W5N2R3_9BACT|nr:MAG: EamA family transporter [Micavibrio aeruginosavorus]